MRLPKVFWVFVLIISIVYLGYSVYMLVWRVSFCSDLETKISTMSTTEVLDNLAYPIAYREVCSGGPGFLPIIVSSVGVWFGFWGLVTSWALSPKKEKGIN